jgi:hypothetical protein
VAGEPAFIKRVRRWRRPSSSSSSFAPLLAAPSLPARMAHEPRYRGWQEDPPDYGEPFSPSVLSGGFAVVE